MLSEGKPEALSQMAFTNPKQLPAAMLEVMWYKMRLETLHGITGFLDAFMDTLDDWIERNKGG